MRERLLEILREPQTFARLDLSVKRRQGEHIEEGSLVSQSTGRVYPIVRGIPRFVALDPYAASFGLQWNRFREAQLDSSTRTNYSRARFEAETGWSAEQLRGKWLLDAGCGSGRFAEVAAESGADLVAVDLSSAVDAARTTLRARSNVDVVQANLLELPFEERTFDFAYCIGVVQHTPDPSRVIVSVLDKVRDGGQFALTIYARRPWTKLNAKYLIRPLTRRLPNTTLLKAIEATVPRIFPLTDLLFRTPYLGRVAHFMIPVASYPERSDMTRQQRVQEAILDTFDMLSPEYDSPMTWEEVDAALQVTAASQWSFLTKRPVNVVGIR